METAMIEAVPSRICRAHARKESRFCHSRTLRLRKKIGVV